MTSYKYRNIEKYCEQLAYDFLFVFDPEDIDPATQPDSVWTFYEDSVATRNMFENENLDDPSKRVLDIRAALTFSALEPGREGQRCLLANVYLDVDLIGVESGTITLRIAGDQAEFCFRRGRTPEDSTSSLWYIVKWTDLPQKRPTSETEAGIATMTWGRIKAMYRGAVVASASEAAVR